MSGVSQWKVWKVWKVWWQVTRPATLWAAVVPVLVGGACAYREGCWRVAPIAAALFGAICIQIGTNLSNDLFDYRKGADTSSRLGPQRALQAGLLTSRSLIIATAASFTLATVAGVYLAWVAGPWIVAIGIASILSGLAYTGGPYPLGYHGLGDLFVFVFFGPVAVVGTVFVACLEIPPMAWWAGAAIGALATAILVVNNLRDRFTDEAAGKRTLAVRLGGTAARAEYALLLSLAYLIPVWLASRYDAVLLLLPCLSLPLALRAALRVFRTDGVELNASLGATAKLLLLFGALFAAGVAAT